MIKCCAWAVFALGLIHIVFGVARYATPLGAVLAEGFFGRFAAEESRRTAFWFILAGPLLMLIGQLAVHAVGQADPGMLRLIGAYMLATSLVGVAAFPLSPLWVPLMLSLPLIAAGWGWWPLR